MIGSRAIHRALRVALSQFRLCALQAMQYRVQFWTEGVLGLLWSLLGVVPLFIAVEHRGAVAGWDVAGLVTLTGMFGIVSGLFGALIQPALAETMAQIRRGSFDYLLLRPVDGMVSAMTSMFNPWRLLEALVGAALVFAGLAQHGALSPSGIAEGAAMLMFGIVIMYALGVLIVAASFRALRLENLTFLLESMLDFGRWPVGVFRGLLKALLTFVFPLAIMTTFPAMAMRGEVDASIWGVSLGVTAVFVIVARLGWNAGVQRYTSASS